MRKEDEDRKNGITGNEEEEEEVKRRWREKRLQELEGGGKRKGFLREVSLEGYLHGVEDDGWTVVLVFEPVSIIYLPCFRFSFDGTEKERRGAKERRRLELTILSFLNIPSSPSSFAPSKPSNRPSLSCYIHIDICLSNLKLSSLLHLLLLSHFPLFPPSSPNSSRSPPTTHHHTTPSSSSEQQPSPSLSFRTGNQTRTSFQRCSSMGREESCSRIG